MDLRSNMKGIDEMKPTAKLVYWLLLTGTFSIIISFSALAQHRGGSYSRPMSGGNVYSARPYYSRPPFGYYYRWYNPYPFFRYYRPYIGLNIRTLPFGYFSFYWGPYRFYYYDGYYYRPCDGGYKIVAPPIGAEISELPKGAGSIKINGQLYYEKNGVYYLPVQKADNSIVYRIVGKDGELNLENQFTVPEIGTIYENLPEGSKRVVINNQKLFVSPDGFYYQEEHDEKGTFYRLVGKTQD